MSGTRKLMLVVLAACVVTSPAGVVVAAEPVAGVLSVEEIVKKANHVAYYQGESGRADVKMTITDSGGNKRERQFIILRRNEDDKDAEQKLYVYFQRPSDVRKMVFLVWKHIDKDDDRWLYLPALDLVKRIAASDNRTSFVGSNFFYEDVSGRSITEDVHELVDTTDIYYVLKNTPKDPDAVEFSYFLMYIHKQTFTSVQTEFYDKSDRKYRVYTVKEVKTIQGYPTVTKAVMKDLLTKGETLLEYATVKYDIDLPEDIFTERRMRSAPRQYLR